MTPRRRAGLAGLASVTAFALAFFLRLDAAYGPFNLSFGRSDWTVLWELWRHGQIASDVALQAVVLGAAAAAVPWLVVARWRWPVRRP